MILDLAKISNVYIAQATGKISLLVCFQGIQHLSGCDVNHNHCTKDDEEVHTNHNPPTVAVPLSSSLSCVV